MDFFSFLFFINNFFCNLIIVRPARIRDDHTNPRSPRSFVFSSYTSHCGSEKRVNCKHLVRELPYNIINIVYAHGQFNNYITITDTYEKVPRASHSW